MSRTNRHNQDEAPKVNLEEAKTHPDHSKHLCWSQTKIIEIVTNSETTVRLNNALLLAINSDFLPVETIGEYHFNRENIQDRFMKLPNMGRKSVAELHALMMSFELTSEPGIQTQSSNPSPNSTVTGTTTCQSIIIQVSNILNIVDLPTLVSGYPLSVRLKNACKNMGTLTEEDGVLLLGNYIYNTREAHVALFRQPNLGQKSIKELELFVEKWLSKALKEAGLNTEELLYMENLISYTGVEYISVENLEGMIKKIANFDFKNYIAPVHMQKSGDASKGHGKAVSYTLQDIVNSTEGAAKKISSLLTIILREREADIINQRFGLVGKKKTLAAIADDYGITRERVRQIETKALRRCKILSHKNIFKQLLSEEKPVLQESLFKKRRMLSQSVLKVVSRNLDPAHKFLIALIDNKVTAWLTRNYYPTIREGVIIAWSIEDAEIDFDVVLDNIELSIPKRISAIIESGTWPMLTSTLEKAMPDVPIPLIRKTLLEDLDASIEDGHIITMGKLSVKARLILVLRMAKRRLHTAEIVAHHKNLFQIDMNQHAVSATLQRLEEALIVERGIYDLYENLQFTKGQLTEIRDIVFDYLIEKGEFISATMLHDELFIHRMQDFPEHLTNYMLMGILQDDDRFNVKRGLMVGLKDAKFKGKFSSLTDEVRSLINEKGPISSKEIALKLSATRKVLTTSVEAVITSLQDVVENSSGHYNKIEREFGCLEKFERIKSAIQINLLDDSISIFSLKERLHKVGIDIPLPTLKSIIFSDENINYEDKLISMIEVSRELQTYKKIIHGVYINSVQENVRNKIKSEIQKTAPKLISYMKLDSKLLASSNNPPLPQSEFLDDLIKEFNT